VSTSAVVEHVAAALNLSFATPADKKAWKATSIRNKLVRLVEAGELERRAEPGKTLYRRAGKLPDVTSLESLRQYVQRVSAEAQAVLD
jgi:hypothetical protein